MKPKIIFSDFDGTLTDHTEFSPKFLEIIQLSTQEKIPFVIVTGRSLSWAHFFLTHFSSLTHVISEGGGVISYRDSEGMIQDEFQVSQDQLDWLEKFAQDLKQRYSIRLSADSLGRVSDRAIELSDLSDPALMDKITKRMEKEGINYSTSNVHLNFWCGDISKYEAVKAFLKIHYPQISVEESVFFGDSLNDQSMFKHIEHSVGVANIEEVINRMEHKPKIILHGDENKGPNGVLSYLQDLLK
ncbi:HAD family hydrolase [Bacteriovorax sp. DB6_IX]|uniref:HAD family hydrolase n=1 Tax=Bacteriovorax sp. DB6_IX TaxID=1353530 RepID=UPI000389FBCE|nr:HAD family hydrolase [Bacteriovorax sp. DB6_IX]EQC47955.1 HAD hydrolase, family IIB [Bacteriovorax sp. DB6_IX]